MRVKTVNSMWAGLCLALVCASCSMPAHRVDTFQPRIRQHPADADKDFNEGFVLSLLQKWPDAATALERAVRKNPADGQAYFYLGLAYAWTSRDTEARAAFEHASEIGGPYGTSRQQMSRVYHAGEDYEAEIAVLREAIEENDPHPYYLRYRLGMAYYANGEKDSTLAIFNDTIPYSPEVCGEYGMWYVMGTICQERGELDRALELYERQLGFQSFDKIGAAYYNLGGIYFNRGDYRNAISLFEEAGRRDPEDVDTCCNLAVAYALDGQYDRVKPILARMQTLDPAAAEYLAGVVQRVMGQQQN